MYRLRTGCRLVYPLPFEPATSLQLVLMSDVGGQGRRMKKIVLLRELHRAIIYTTKMSKQVIQSHVRYSLQCTA
jgi:hypothetical protein